MFELLGALFLLVMYWRVEMVMLLEPCFFLIMGTYCFASGKLVSGFHSGSRACTSGNSFSGESFDYERNFVVSLVIG